ncbi:TRL-like family protein [Leptospira levettii]|nr:TRL-like family protein [Leptospira levettii]TGM68896.1 TRL-like family protein [Leptospira levettii]
MEFHLKFKIFFLVNCLFLCKCTGFNLLYETSAIGNTNPSREYATTAPMWKGGFFYHRNTTPGPIGIGVEPKAEGRACSNSYLGLFSFGNSRIEAAKKNGNIQKVAFVDYENSGVFAGFIYHQFCTIVKGSN